MGGVGGSMGGVAGGAAVSVTLDPLSDTDTPELLTSERMKVVVAVAPGAPAVGVKDSASSAAVTAAADPERP